VSGFDPLRWEKRVRSRHHKRTKVAPPERRRDEDRRLADDLRFIKGIEEVVSWCSFRRISVEFYKGCGGTYDSSDRTIRINSRQSIEKQLYVLLHECGHLLIDDRSETTGFRFRHGYHAPDSEIRRRFIYKCTIVEEELEAWHRGRKLAGKLGIKINDDVFSTLKATFIKSYMKWALGDPDYRANGPR